MKHLLIILSFLLLSSPLFGQSEKPLAIVIPTASLGDISKTRIKILEKTLESKIDDFFAIVPKELFEEAQEQAFQELNFDECTEDQCIRMIQEILQVENAFQMLLISEEGDTQVSVTWNDQDQKRVEEDFCEGCKTKELRLIIGGLIDKLLGNVIKKEVLVRKEEVVQIENQNNVELFAFGTEENIFDSYINLTILSSNDGNRWAKYEHDDFSLHNLNSISANGNIIVLVGDSGSIYTSKNGRKWFEIKLNTDVDLNDVISIKNKFVAVGNSGIIAFSNDAKEWKVIQTNTKANLNGIVFGNGKYVAYGNDGKVLVSENGVNWKGNILSDFLFHAISFGNNLFVAVGASGSVFSSDDGMTWSKVHIFEVIYNYLSPYDFNAVTYGNGHFVIVGEGGTSVHSEDWIMRDIFDQRKNRSLFDIVYANSKYYAVGEYGILASSKDGVEWRKKDYGTDITLKGITLN